MTTRVLLVDVSGIAHAAFHVTTNDADPNAMSNATIARVRELAAGYTHVAVCIDTGKSFRADISPAYKAHREAKPAHFHHQYKRAVEVLAKDGYLTLGAQLFEADDVIATAVAWLRKNAPDADVMIATSDKDLACLIDESGKVCTWSLAKNERVTFADVTARYGIEPRQMPEWLALTGDASDAIEGIRGVGPKHASRLLLQFGSLAGIYAALNQTPDEVKPPSIREALVAGVGTLDLALKLVALRTDAPVDCSQILAPRKQQPLTDDRSFEEEEGDDDMDIDQETGEVTDTPKPPPPAPPHFETSSAIVTTPPTVVLSSATPPNWSRELEPRSFDQATKLAKFMHDSRMFTAYGSPQAVLSTILAGRELGVGAMASLRGFHIIEGKVSMSAGLMAALVLSSGKAKWFSCSKRTNTSATVSTWRIGEPAPFEVTYTIEDAQTAKLVKKDGGWDKNPADMCVARATAILARLKYQDVCFGMYTPEELGREDIDDAAA